MTRYVHRLILLLAMLLLARPLTADDIDIYRAGDVFGPMRVMLSLDLRAGVARQVCGDAAAISCAATLGDRLYRQLDLFGTARLVEGGFVLQRGADGLADMAQADPRHTGQVLAASWAGNPVDDYDVLRAALRAVLTELGAALRGAPEGERIEVGLMANHAADCPGAGPRYLPDYTIEPASACSRGAYILQGFTDISERAGLDRLLLRLAALPDPGSLAPWQRAPWAGHPYSIRDTYLELFRYLTGQAVFNGFLGASDYGSRYRGNLYHTREGEVINDVLVTTPDGRVDLPLLAPDTAVLRPGSFDLQTNRLGDAAYVSPVESHWACPRVTLLNVMFGAGSEAHPDTDAAIAAAREAGGLGIQLATGDAGDRRLVAALAGDGPADAPPVKSYFLVPRVTATSAALAAAGGTGQPLTLHDPGALVAALEKVFSPQAGESTSLVAGTLPFGPVGGQRETGDIYYALFQPGPYACWRGNIKKLKLVPGQGSGGAALPESVVAQAPLARPPVPALSAEDGLILPDALTFWTDPLGPDVLAFDPALAEVPGRDGRSVDRGGAGQRVPGFLAGTPGLANSDPGARQMFTLDPDLPGELLPLDASPRVVTAIGDRLDPQGQMTVEQRLALLRWIRGFDSFDLDGDGQKDETRAWLLADVLHSRPLAINYGARGGSGYSEANPDIRVFFGTNDGLFHMLRNTSTGGGSPESGSEEWAFLPLDLLPMQAALARGRPAAGGSHHYGMDGEAVVYIHDRDRDGNIEAGEGDLAWVFVGQRRGGRSLYAFDVSDPDRPRFKWMIDHTTAGFERLALTFSTPRVARLDLGGAALTPVLVFGGGYNGGWSGGARVGKDAGSGPDTIGNAIFVVAADDGELLWQAQGPGAGPAPTPADNLYIAPDLTHSIPSPVTVIDADRNGVEDRVYVGDSGGNVWRVDLSEHAAAGMPAGVAPVAEWSLRRLAALGGSGASNRRFFHAPDVVQSRDRWGEYDGVVMLSGNRAAPLESHVEDFAYLIKDRASRWADDSAGAADSGTVSHGQLADISIACVDAKSSGCLAVDLSHGWKLALQGPGEKGLSTPLVSGGRVLFTSYVPPAGAAHRSCSTSAGSTLSYAVNLGNGSPGPIPPESLQLQDNSDRFENLGEGLRGDIVPWGDRVLLPGQPPTGEQLPEVPGRSRWRTYWREAGVDEP